MAHFHRTSKPIDNQKLSENRAKAVVAFLTTKGSDTKTLLFKGLGDKNQLLIIKQ